MKLQTLKDTQELATVLSGWRNDHKEKFIAELEAQLQERMKQLVNTIDPQSWPNLQGRAAELQRLVHLLKGVVKS